MKLVHIIYNSKKQDRSSLKRLIWLSESFVIHTWVHRWQYPTCRWPHRGRINDLVRRTSHVAATWNTSNIVHSTKKCTFINIFIFINYHIIILGNEIIKIVGGGIIMIGRIITNVCQCKRALRLWPYWSKLTGSNHRCRAHFKGAQTVIGQRFAGNGPNGL